MRAYIALAEPRIRENDIVCFLAGGITDCWNWQQAVIDELKKFDNTERLVVCSPRRENFPIDDPNAAEKQIRWEYNMLHQANIFSMYFAGGKSVQPICMYELGVHLTRFQLSDSPEAVVISVESEYSREQDVVIQTKLALGHDIVNLNADPKSHAQLIYKDYLNLL